MFLWLQPAGERGTAIAVSHSCLHGDRLQISALAWPVNLYLSLIYWVCENAYHCELTAEGTQSCPAACKVLCNAKCKENGHVVCTDTSSISLCQDLSQLKQGSVLWGAVSMEGLVLSSSRVSWGGCLAWGQQCQK